jgi:hypothetical protein
MPNSTPPPLPTPSGRPIAAAPPAADGPSPLAAKLRELGMLPPLNLKGEYALGAWWTGRIGGVLFLAAVIFYGIYLNINGNFPAWFMVGEIAAIGIAIFWFSLRLSLRNQDLGRVIGAAGLGVLQFAAWSTYGLKHFNIGFDSMLGSSVLQFVAAIGVVVIALWRQDKWFAQLAVVFAGVAVFFAIQNPDSAVKIDDYVNVLGVIMVALIGVVLMLRGSWGSAGWLGLLVSQLCLSYWQYHLGTGHYSVAIQLTALFCFATLWVGGRFLTDSKILGGTRSHETFQLASFFVPALIAFVACSPADYGRSNLGFVLAAIALVLGWLERARSTNISQIMFISALVFAAAGITARLSDNLWIVWLLAAALAQLLATRTKSILGRTATEALAAVSAYFLIFNVAGSTTAAVGYPWASLVAIAGMALLVSFREEWEHTDEWQYFLRICGLVVLGAALVGVQQCGVRMIGGAMHMSHQEMTGWPWLVVGAIAIFRYRKALIWAALPAYLVSCILALTWMSSAATHPATDGWHAFWLLIIGLTQAGIIWKTAERKEEWVLALQHAFTFTMAFLLTWAAFICGLWFVPNGWSAQVSAWFGGALLISAVAAWLALSESQFKKMVLALPGFLAAYVVINGSAWGDLTAFVGPKGLVGGLFWLLGLGLLLRALARYTAQYADQEGESAQRTVIGALLLVYTLYVSVGMTAEYSVTPSVVWVLAAILFFVLGHFNRSKSFRMLGLAGLAFATCRMFTVDITGTASRVVAVGIIAVAFLGVAWLYGRMNTEKQDPAA